MLKTLFISYCLLHVSLQGNHCIICSRISGRPCAFWTLQKAHGLPDGAINTKTWWR